MKLPILIAVLLEGCGSARPPPPRHTEDSALVAIASRSEHVACGAIPLDVDCDSHDAGYWTFRANGHDVSVVRMRARDATGPGWQRTVSVDGKRYPELPPAGWFVEALGDLSTLSRADAQILLEVIAVTGPIGDAMWNAATRDEVAALAEIYPRAAAMIRTHPAGFGRDLRGAWHMRVYATTPALVTDVAPVRWQCPVISMVELAIEGGNVVLLPLDTRSLADTVDGERCIGPT